jgi:hypothetical protein
VRRLGDVGEAVAVGVEAADPVGNRLHGRSLRTATSGIMVRDVDLDTALLRLDALAGRIGRRSRFVGAASVLLAAAAWALLLRRLAFDGIGAFAAWLPLLLVLALPGLVLLGFGKRVLRLGPAVGRIADGAGVVLADVRGEAVEAVDRGGLRGLLGALRELGKHGDRVRGLAADAVGTARIVGLPYLGLVALASLGAAAVFVLALVGVVTLAF